MVAYNVKELISILIRNGLSSTCLISSASSYLLYNTQIPVFSSKISYIFLPPTFFLSCFIFMFQLIENQTFQEMKHWCSMFHFWFQCFIFYLPHPFPKKHNGSDLKTQWERFKTSMGEKSNPNGRNATETLKSKMKHRMPMFHLLKVLIINVLCYENETWNKKRLKVNIMYAYVRARKERVLTWGRRVPEAAEKSPDVGRRYRCNICVSH